MEREKYVRRYNESYSSEFPVGFPDPYTRKTQRLKRCDDNKKMRTIFRLLITYFFCLPKRVERAKAASKTRQSIKQEIGNHR